MTGKVHHIERCPNNAALLRFFWWWGENGPFDLVIVTGSRTDAEQLDDFRKGRQQLATGQWIVVDQTQVVTNALGAKDSAHGHDAGADCLPVREMYPTGGVRLVYLGTEEDPFVRQQAVLRLDEYDRIAKTFGLETGECYPGICDRPHVCDPTWKTLPLGPGVAA